MTTIVGIQKKDRAIIAVDSRVTDDDGRIYSHPDMMKYAERGSFLIAGSGEVLPCDIVQNMWTPPRLLLADKANIYKFMITKVMPSIREVLTKNGYNFDEAHDKKEGERFHFLIACNGELFDVDQELSVTRDARGYYAIGSGGPYALGALYMGASPLNALEVAANISAFTAAPFYTVEQYKN
jgi:ATP-dependent protease HslVU (ClpYQ) peptidase subunit